MAVFEKVQDIIADELGKDKEEITLDTTFEELDADSLDLFQIINDIEDEFEVEVDTDQDLKTVSELVNYVEENQK
jgi:acyl carrier protein